MRRFAPVLAVLLTAPLLIGAGQPLPVAVPRTALSEADRAEVDAISAALNAITTLKGEFLQIEPSGVADEGTFYISKPGKVRFEYKPPVPTLIVSDGSHVAVANTRLNTVDRYSLSDTPLKFILSNTIDLRHNQQLVSVAHMDGALVLNLKSDLNRRKPDIAILFSEPDHELRQWTVIDNQGMSTTTALRNVQPGAPLDPALFLLPEKKR